MLGVTVFELVLRIIPEAFVFMFATYAFSNTKFNVKRYIISSLLLGISVHIVRKLPIDYGVHTILNIVIQTVIAASINKIVIIKAIRSAIISALCLLILEAVNVLILSLVFKDGLEVIMLNPTLKIIYSLPSFVFFAVIIITFYYINRKGKIKNV